MAPHLFYMARPLFGLFLNFVRKTSKWQRGTQLTSARPVGFVAGKNFLQGFVMGGCSQFLQPVRPYSKRSMVNTSAYLFWVWAIDSLRSHDFHVFPSIFRHSSSWLGSNIITSTKGQCSATPMIQTNDWMNDMILFRPKSFYLCKFILFSRGRGFETIISVISPVCSQAGTCPARCPVPCLCLLLAELATAPPRPRPRPRPWPW